MARNSVLSKLGTGVPFLSGKKVVGGIVGVVVLIVGVLGFSFFGWSPLDSLRHQTGQGDSIRVASFNGEIFGDAKISNVGVDYYVDLISDYDLFFLLEIRDVDNSSFYELCSGLVGYECYLSARSGRTISKEAVGVFVRSDLSVLGLEEYEDDSFPFERVPVWVDVSQLDSQGYRTGQGVRYWVVHLSPENVYREMEALEALVLGIGDLGFGTVVLGDMNADCDYYSSGVDFSPREDSGEPHSWNWVIGDDEDTVTGFKDCAYDRIITKGVEVLDGGVVEIDARVSDHNLVWVEIGK